ncbi:uncharacterized protein [Vulpes vulpes]|uniref:Basic proline-rich protein-like n=1 Tax=Vulpes vulpes TaxID=9627 RepID=A0ABM4ZGU5_VULVU
MSDFTSRRWAAAAVHPGAPRCPRAEAYAWLPSPLCVPSALGAAPSPLSRAESRTPVPEVALLLGPADRWTDGRMDRWASGQSCRGLCGRTMQPGRRGLSAEGRWAPRTGCKVRPRNPPQCALGASVVGAAAFTQCPWGPSGPLAPSLGVALSVRLQKLSASRTIEDTFGSLVQALCWDCPFPCVSAPGEAASTARRPCPLPPPPPPAVPAVPTCPIFPSPLPPPPCCGAVRSCGLRNADTTGHSPPCAAKQAAASPGPSLLWGPSRCQRLCEPGTQRPRGQGQGLRMRTGANMHPPSGRGTGQPHGLPQPPASPCLPLRAPPPQGLSRAHHRLLKEGIGSSLHSMRNHVQLVLCAWIACAGPRGKGTMKQAAGRV